MECLSDLIRNAQVDNVTVHLPFQPTITKACLNINGHHIIMSKEKEEKVKILHRNVDFVDKQSFAEKTGGSLTIKCKDLKSVCVDIMNNEEFASVVDSIEKLSAIVNIEWSFPFYYQPSFTLMEDGWTLYQLETEYAKMINGTSCSRSPRRTGLPLQHHQSSSSEWRVSYVNANYNICPTYPRAVVVPSAMGDDVLRCSARFRQGGRFPVLSYRHPSSGTVIVRCSQPLVGLQNKRCREDEALLAAINGKFLGKGFIIDTRTVPTIQNARAKGGGQELEVNYPGWKKINRGIDRYHFLLDSYSKLMEAVTDTGCSQDKWMSRLTVSSWLTHVKDILTCGCLVAQCLEREKSSVVVHGSEGMDITLCVTSIAQVILNPDCRTVRGFEALIEREWLQAGHPFWSRTTKGPFNDSVASKSKSHAPTFTMFMDCIYQILHQFPCSFEFNDRFLMFLSDNAYSSDFGTFLADSEYERNTVLNLKDKTVSLWSHVNRPEVLASFLNCMYEPNLGIIWPSVAPVSLILWRDMYMRYTIENEHNEYIEKKVHEIIESNSRARQNVMQLRRQLIELEKEARELGIVDPELSLINENNFDNLETSTTCSDECLSSNT